MDFYHAQARQMKSGLRFVMHPDDEDDFAAFVLSDATVRFIDGPRWKTESANCFRTLKRIGGYCIIWSPDDLAELTSRYIPTCEDWYCESEYATIQFLRSEIGASEVTVGRIAIGTNHRDSDFSESNAKQVEARYNRLRRFLKKNYSNSVVHWYNSGSHTPLPKPRRPPAYGDPVKNLWVGPKTLRWLRENRNRRVRQHSSYMVGFV